MNPIYVLLCGLPAAGKSTLASTLYDKWRTPKPIILSTDEYIETVAICNGTSYSEEFQTHIKSAEQYVAGIRDGALRAGMDVIHDDACISAKSRIKKLHGVPPSYLKVCLVVGASEKARRARLLNHPGKIIPPEVDAQMRTSWQDPTFTEGFDEILYDWNWDSALFPYLQVSESVLESLA